MTQHEQSTESALTTGCGDVPGVLLKTGSIIDVEDCLTSSNEGCSVGGASRQQIEIETYEMRLGRWLGEDHIWTHFVTPTTHANSLLAKRPSIELGLSFRASVVQYYDVLALDVYGRKTHQRPIMHATSFECRSKFGNWTPWHAHSLVYVEPEFWKHFETKAVKLWTRRFCNRPDAIVVERITHNMTKVASYSAKHDSADCGIEPLYSKEFKHSK